MKILLVTRERTIPCKLPYDGAPHVEVEFPCSECGSKLIAGMKGTQRRDHDTHYADAGCVGCGHFCGELRVKVSTIFGIEEDERVLNGRPRVY